MAAGKGVGSTPMLNLPRGLLVHDHLGSRGRVLEQLWLQHADQVADPQLGADLLLWLVLAVAAGAATATVLFLLLVLLLLLGGGLGVVSVIAPS